MDNWISVNTPPEESDEYIVVWQYIPDDWVVTCMDYDVKGNKFYQYTGGIRTDCTSEVILWQPLPQLPTWLTETKAV